MVLQTAGALFVLLMAAIGWFYLSSPLSIGSSSSTWLVMPVDADGRRFVRLHRHSFAAAKIGRLFRGDSRVDGRRGHRFFVELCR